MMRSVDLVTFCKVGDENSLHSMKVAKHDGGAEPGGCTLFDIPSESLKDVFRGIKDSTLVSHMDSLFVIGGCDSDVNPKSDVFRIFFDPFRTVFRGVSKYCSLSSPKYLPIVISAPPRIFVFSRVLHDCGFPPFCADDVLEPFPRCEFLDCNPALPVHRWCGFDLPSPPLPPPPTGQSPFTYEIDAFAASPKSLYGGVYLSIRHLCSYFVAEPSHGWTICPNELPFFGEAKRLGDSRSYVGQSRSQHQFGSICIYNLVEDTQDFNFYELCVFPSVSIPTIPFSNHISHDWMFQSLSHDTICFINCCVASSEAQSIDLSTTESHFIVVGVLKLFRGNVGESGDGGGGSTKKKRKNQQPKMKLLWHKKYPNMPLHYNWCLMK